MPDPAVRTDLRPDRVAVLTIDQPGAKVNVLTTALWAELEAALDALAARTDVAGLVVASGKPGVFIAGADLKLLATATPGDPAVRAFIEQGLRVLAKLESLPFPTCAAIDGVALGGGLEVALACDYRLIGTHPRVQLALPEVQLGLIPGWGGTQRLPRATEWDVAVSMLLTGESLGSGDAVIAGLGDGIGSASLMGQAPRTLLESVSGWFLDGRSRRNTPVVPPTTRDEPPSPAAEAAGRELQQLLGVATTTAQAEGIARETEAFLRLAGSAESREKIAAFFAARPRPAS